MDLNDTGYDNPRSSNALKITGTIFGLIIAPVIAGIIANIGSFFVQKKLEAPLRTKHPSRRRQATPRMHPRPRSWLPHGRR